LTKREKEERDHKRKLLTLAKEHDKARELENVQRYHMPLGKKVSVPRNYFQLCNHSGFYFREKKINT